MGRVIKMWPVILAALMCAVAFGVLKTEVSGQGAEIKETKAIVDRHSQQITRLETIAEMIPELRADVKSLLRSQRVSRDTESRAVTR